MKIVLRKKKDLVYQGVLRGGEVEGEERSGGGMMQGLGFPLRVLLDPHA